MRTIIYLLQKEFIQIFRNKTMLPIIFAMPVVQLIVLVYAANLEMKNIEMCVIDKDLSSTSRQLISKFSGSKFYKITQTASNIKKGKEMLYEDKADIIIYIPAGFEKTVVREGSADIQILINAINSTTAGLIDGYTTAVTSDYNMELINNWFTISEDMMKKIEIVASFWYNPEMDYKIYMVPGILVILVTVMGMFLTALNLVREKEIGTIEQINVTPIKKYQFIIGKLFPFWVIAMFEFAFGLMVGRLLFNLPIEANPMVIFGFAGIYMIVGLGLGLFMSTITNTQQQVMFLTWFFMLTFILMSGIFTPEESMPVWAQKANIVNPFAYFMRANRMMLLKGSGFWDVSKDFFSLAIYGTIILFLAVWRYRKTS